VAIRNNFPEYSNEWVYVPEKEIKLKEQIICSVDDTHLINVLKIYTNNLYFGVMFTSVEPSGTLINMFRCKDKGFPENLVDNKEAFINLYTSDFGAGTLYIAERSEFKSFKPDFLQEYQVEFILNPDGTYFATTGVINNTAPFRGLYGSSTKEGYERIKERLGISIFNRFPTEEEIQTHIIDKQLNTMSANFITRVNTAYSNVKVFHRSEINNGT